MVVPSSEGCRNGPLVALFEDGDLPLLPVRVKPKDVEVVIGRPNLEVQVVFARPAVQNLGHVVLASVRPKAKRNGFGSILLASDLKSLNH